MGLVMPGFALFIYCRHLWSTQLHFLYIYIYIPSSISSFTTSVSLFSPMVISCHDVHVQAWHCSSVWKQRCPRASCWRWASTFTLPPRPGCVRWPPSPLMLPPLFPSPSLSRQKLCQHSSTSLSMSWATWPTLSHSCTSLRSVLCGVCLWVGVHVCGVVTLL